jgi:hypothetical protein
VITLVAGHFALDAPYLSEPALESYARKLFGSFDETVRRAYPLPDYGLRLDLEEGSLKGTGKVLAGLAALYYGIGHFGSFMQGLDEIGKIGTTVTNALFREAPRALDLPPQAIKGTRRDNAKIGKLERLFRRVQKGELDPETATAEALAVLEDEGDVVPEAFRRDLTEAVRRLPRPAEQFGFPWADTLEMAVVEDALPPQPKRARSLAPEAALPPRKLHIEVWRDTKDGEALVRILPL